MALYDEKLNEIKISVPSTSSIPLAEDRWEAIDVEGDLDSVLDIENPDQFLDMAEVVDTARLIKKLKTQNNGVVKYDNRKLWLSWTTHRGSCTKCKYSYSSWLNKKGYLNRETLCLDGYHRYIEFMDHCDAMVKSGHSI